MWYMKKQIESSKAKKKVFFMITDGSVEEWDVEQGTTVANALRRDKVKTIGIFLGSRRTPQQMEDMFTPECCVGCQDADGLEKLLTRDITQMVVKHIKGL